ncbi:Imm32 family immunity protein [Micromonospora lupini]|uniref:Uncharacterized protein n=1 Tax=Micromonospora lupini str. Lupac 08 TaxID=1150864 RepID=I0L9B2_9ACTN|nr:hypothetical protein MILUP08_45291 [Micromonospora lupini str. Lupac 08]
MTTPRNLPHPWAAECAHRSSKPGRRASDTIGYNRPGSGTYGCGTKLDYYSAAEGVDITSDRAADQLRDTATMHDGGHVHLEYVKGHPYLAPGSVPLILNSPRGGMPRR